MVGVRARGARNRGLGRAARSKNQFGGASGCLWRSTTMGGRDRVLGWLLREWQWPAASLFAAGFLLPLTPIWFSTAGPALALVYLQLPVYLLHQWEEHTGDRFRHYVNRHLAGGREGLTPAATSWITALGVWGVDLVALYLAGFVHCSFGLIAVYLPLLNAVGHIAPALVRREYNPGLWTALVLFLPVGGWSWYVVGAASAAGWAAHAAGAGVAVAVHAAIVVHVLRRIVR